MVCVCVAVDIAYIVLLPRRLLPTFCHLPPVLASHSSLALLTFMSGFRARARGRRQRRVRRSRSCQKSSSRGRFAPLNHRYSRAAPRTPNMPGPSPSVRQCHTRAPQYIQGCSFATSILSADICSRFCFKTGISLRPAPSVAGAMQLSAYLLAAFVASAVD